MSDYSLRKQNERIERALKQRMFLISAKKEAHREWDFVVEGTRGINYIVKFEHGGMTCECPDFEGRHRNCKHMFFVIGRIAQLSLGKFKSDKPDFNVFDLYPDLTGVLDNVLLRRLKSEYAEEIPKLTSEDDCCVCFESMVKGKLISCETCKNVFHDSCMLQWLSNSTRTNCPLCRTAWKHKVVNVDVFSKLVT